MITKHMDKYDYIIKESILDTLMLNITNKTTNYTKLAKETGITDHHISQIFNGNRRPRTDTLVKLLDIMGYELNISKKEVIYD